MLLYSARNPACSVRKVVPASKTTEGALCIELRIRAYHDGAMSKLLEKLSKVRHKSKRLKRSRGATLLLNVLRPYSRCASFNMRRQRSTLPSCVRKYADSSDTPAVFDPCVDDAKVNEGMLLPLLGGTALSDKICFAACRSSVHGHEAGPAHVAGPCAGTLAPILRLSALIHTKMGP